MRRVTADGRIASIVGEKVVSPLGFVLNPVADAAGRAATNAVLAIVS